MKLFFAIISYIAGIGSMALYFWMIQFGMDQPTEIFSVSALIVNLVLFGLFPLQHSILPRPRFKKMIGEVLGDTLIRSFYVLTSGVVMWILLLNWRNFGPYLYRSDSPIVFNIIFYIALVLIILSTVALDHSMMFGLKQGYAGWKNRTLPESTLRTDGIFGVVRHPLTSLLLVALWSHHTLTAGRLLFNLLFSAYAIAGTWFEERDLLKQYGEDYQEYRRKVPAFIPGLGDR